MGNEKENPSGSLRDKIETFGAKYRPALHDGQRHAFASVAQEVQTSAVQQLNQMMKAAQALKAEAVQAADERAANFMLSLQLVAESIAHELVMWIYLKNEQAEEAWDSLVRSQRALSSAIRTGQSGNEMHARVERLEVP